MALPVDVSITILKAHSFVRVSLWVEDVLLDLENSFWVNGEYFAE